VEQELGFSMRAILIDLDGALGDTRPLWNDWLAVTARVLGVDPATLPTDRAAAATELDAAGAGNWRTLLERFAAERAPVYLRPNAAVSAALRRLAATGRPVGVFTDAPAELARVAVAQLGAARRIAALETGSGALERLARAIGGEAVVVRTRDALVDVAGSSGDQEARR
jgi:phosphoglycolate phosphatase-like HAD superfamily hydrolase